MAFMPTMVSVDASVLSELSCCLYRLIAASRSMKLVVAIVDAKNNRKLMNQALEFISSRKI